MTKRKNHEILDSVIAARSEILVKNLSSLIEGLLQEGTVGMSQKNLQQICPTKGLNCSISQYHAAFDEALKVTVKKYPNFQVYQ